MRQALGAIDARSARALGWSLEARASGRRPAARAIAPVHQATGAP